MIIATIKKLDGTLLDHGKFASEAEALAWFQPFINKGVYGQKYLPRLTEDRQVLVSEAVYDEQGVETSPAVYETVTVVTQEEVLADFTVTHDQYIRPQEEINREAKDYLDSTDWYIIRMNETGTPVPQEVLTARAEARARIVR